MESSIESLIDTFYDRGRYSICFYRKNYNGVLCGVHGLTHEQGIKAIAEARKLNPSKYYWLRPQ